MSEQVQTSTSKSSNPTDFFFPQEIDRYRETFYTNLKRISKEKKKSYAQICKLSGYNISHLSHCYARNAFPSMDAIIQIACVLGVEPSSLLLPVEQAVRQDFLFNEVRENMDVSFYGRLLRFIQYWGSEEKHRKNTAAVSQKS